MPVNPGQPESRCSEATGGRNATQTLDETELILRESIPRQVDKKSGSPQGERGLEFSRRRKRQTLCVCVCLFFSSTFLSLSHIKRFYL